MLRIHLMSFLTLLLRKLSLIQREEKSPHLLKNVGKFCIRIRFFTHIGVQLHGKRRLAITLKRRVRCHMPNAPHTANHGCKAEQYTTNSKKARLLPQRHRVRLLMYYFCFFRTHIEDLLPNRVQNATIYPFS